VAALTPSAKPAPAAGAVRRSLLGWFDAHGRDLPWRRDRDPYRTWVSEVMLQQTRADVVAPRFRDFLLRFPTLSALASASEDQVMACWTGLGYYRRARRLHEAARQVQERFGGRLPQTPDELRALPGVGDYTAAAVASVAFGHRVAAVDANVERVLARLLALEDPGSNGGDRAALGAFAERLVACARPGDVNEALMDLGSSLCTAARADCERCPLRRWCRAAGPHATDLPRRRARPAPRRLRLACAVVSRGQRVLFLQRPDDAALLGGLWELPAVEVTGEGDPVAAMAALLRERAGLEGISLAGPVATVRHEIVGRRIVAEVYAGEINTGERWRAATGVRLLARSELGRVGTSALPVKVLAAVGPFARASCRATRAAARR
jgi:A/G-specific adenine glycosylase